MTVGDERQSFMSESFEKPTSLTTDLIIIE